MVTVYIGGGLANKMFQYAFSLGIREQGYDVVFDTHSFLTEFAHDQVRLDDIFPNVSLPESKDEYLAAGKSSKAWRMYKRLCPGYVMEHAYQYNDKVYSQIRRKCMVEGSWQDERYFLNVNNEVRHAFAFPPLTDERNKEVARMMQGCNSVAIHIRKGDGYGTWNIFSNTCEKDYYDNAIAYIKRYVDNPRFFVFADKPEITQQYLSIGNYTIINWNPTTGKQNYFDMQLMSCAKHNIIANSTYSWWGAWLNNNPNKLVIGPRYWFSPQSKLANINHIIPSDWIKL